jgi:predicted kinase
MLWEGSRIILPEHKEALLRHRESRNKKTRQLLDDQAQEEINRALQEALQTGKIIEIVEFNEYQDQAYTGLATRFDAAARRIRLETSEGVKWIPLDDIISARL